MSFVYNCLKVLSDYLQDFGISIFGSYQSYQFYGHFDFSFKDSNVIEIDTTPTTDSIRIFTPWTGNYYDCTDKNIDEIITKLLDYEIPIGFVKELLLYKYEDPKAIENFCRRWKKPRMEKLIVQNEEEIDQIEDFRMAANDWYKKEALSDIYIPEPKYSFVWEV